MECCKRPSRSDAHPSVEEEAKIEEETREYFDGIAPKRHTKPQRSEYSSNYVDALPTGGDNDPIPELEEFNRLEDNTQKLIYSGGRVEEEFVETEYYKDLNGIDKQHHQTGTGFIKIGRKGSDKSFSLAPDNSGEHHASCKGNPATNDWIPSAAETVNIASGKPSRSDN